VTGTALTEARAAANARRGFVGTTTVKSAVHTATQESPVQLPFTTSDDGSRNSAAAMPSLAATSNASPMCALTESGSRPLRVSAATNRATTIEIAPGPQRTKLPSMRARCCGIRSVGNSVMKNTKAYSSASTRSRETD
jgi:hypothetical protein